MFFSKRAFNALSSSSRCFFERVAFDIGLGGIFHDDLSCIEKNLTLSSAAYSAAALAVTMAAAIASLWSLFQGGPRALRTLRK